MKMMMARIIMAALGLMMLGLVSLKAEDTEILKIRELYQAIENSADLKKELVEVDGDEAGGISLTRFTTGTGELKKLIAKTGGDHGVSYETFYYDDGKLFFVFASSDYWVFAGEAGENGESKTKDVAKERRLYFSGKKCLRHLLKMVETEKENGAKPLLAKAENVVVSDGAEEELFFRERGVAFAKLTTKAELKSYLER